LAKQVSIRFEPENYDWLKEQLQEIKPATTLNKLVNFIVQQAREKETTQAGIYKYYIPADKLDKLGYHLIQGEE